MRAHAGNEMSSESKSRKLFTNYIFSKLSVSPPLNFSTDDILESS